MRLARLGPSHGYRIDGDSVELNAEIGVSSAGSAGAPALALSLWACDEPYQGGTLSGFKVAETRVPVPGSGDVFTHGATSFARPPARVRDYAMVLVLGAEGAEALQVVDFANYPQRQRFVVPHLLGSASYELAADERVWLRAARVLNPRAEDNLSGSLELQLWALREPYAAGEPRGTQLASAPLGRLSGQASFDAVELQTALRRPRAGEGHVALLLCEWTAEGHLVRDFCNFAEPYAGACVAEPAAVPAAKPVAVSQPAMEAVPAAKPVAVSQPASDAAVQAAKPAAASQPAPAVPAAKPAAASQPAPAAAPSGPAAANAKPSAPAPAAKASQRPSLNLVSEAELIRLTGMQKKLATQLLAARPFKSFDELVAVRGIGDKTVQRLRTLFSL